MYNVHVSPGRLRKFLFSLSLKETTFAKHGFFQGTIQAQEKFHMIIHSFLQGYNAALANDCFEVLVPYLQTVETEFRGFAFEGAAMEMALFDFFLPWKQRLRGFLQGPGANHIYELHIGAGWMLKWLPRSYRRLMKQFDPLLGWLIVDGYGFHQGFSSWRCFLQEHTLPRHLRGYAQRVFDQGLGRSIWFVKGANPSQISATIEAFPSFRRSDLWSGIGVACTYAGGVNREVMLRLREAAGEYRLHLAQGATFAAMARKRAGNPMTHTDLACEVFSGYTSDEAVEITNETLYGLPQNEHAYEMWRSRVRARLAVKKERARYAS